MSVLAIRDGKVLLVRRARPPFAAAWALPGGKVNAGERLEAAAAREVLEETGVAIHRLARHDVVEIIERDSGGLVSAHFVLVVFTAEADAASPHAADDAADARWVALNEALGLDLTPDTRRLLEAWR